MISQIVLLQYRDAVSRCQQFSRPLAKAPWRRQGEQPVTHTRIWDYTNSGTRCFVPSIQKHISAIYYTWGFFFLSRLIYPSNLLFIYLLMMKRRTTIFSHRITEW